MWRLDRNIFGYQSYIAGKEHLTLCRQSDFYLTGIFQITGFSAFKRMMKTVTIQTDHLDPTCQLREAGARCERGCSKP